LPPLRVKRSQLGTKRMQICKAIRRMQVLMATRNRIKRARGNLSKRNKGSRRKLTEEMTGIWSSFTGILRMTLSTGVMPQSCIEMKT